MDAGLRAHGERIVREAIAAVLPEAAVRRALAGFQPSGGRLILVAAGKAAWRMTAAALDCVSVDGGVAVTKYGHSMGALPGVELVEAGHPVPDENSFRGAKRALELVQGLTRADTVLFLLSGGASALFELPLVPPEELRDVTAQLLASGADITEINTIRKRLSAVKGGRFGAACAPARVFTVALSDVLGDRPDCIGSGPAWPDSSTCGEALAIAARYALRLSPAAWDCLHRETPKSLDNAQCLVTGSVRALMDAAAASARTLGYETVVLPQPLTEEARDAGTRLAELALSRRDGHGDTAFIAGGETVVHLRGHGLGGRNQELALSAARRLRGIPGVAVFSVGSDGTDGPTDAAGGYADGDSWDAIARTGRDPLALLEDNDSYHALDAAGCLLRTGPTGTNVNDLTVALTRGGK